MSNQQDENFGLEEIGQIAVPVSDIDRAIAFYRDILGMRFLFKAPPGLGFFDCNGVRLLLDAPVNKQEKNYSSIIYYLSLDKIGQFPCGKLPKGRNFMCEQKKDYPRAH
jgi:methylmalonyl-CoA/ethylmalonyl-CoA epimerase